jgi:general secretion pathway protein K
MALLSTLLVLAVLLTLASSLAFAVRTETVLSASQTRRAQAAWLAEAGLHRALVALRDDSSIGSVLAEAETNTSEPVVLTLDSSEEPDLVPEGGGFVVQVLDESAKLNLNTVDEATLGRLLPSEPQIVDAVLDWRDADDEPRAEGAEADWYLTLKPPYKARNAAFQTVEELLLVRGVTAGRFYGQDGLSPLADDAERQAVDPTRTPLGRLFTVYSRDQNVDAQGRARLNLTKATKEQFRSEFGNVLTPEEIDKVVNYVKPPSSTQQGGGGQQPTPSTTGSPRPTTRQTAAPTGAPASQSPPATTSQRRVTVAGLVNVLEREKLRRIWDRLTDTDDRETVGVVNLNTAPAEVLAALEGMEQTVADAIVAARGQNPYETVGDLLGLTEVTNERFEQVAARLTTRGLALRIVALGAVGSGREAVRQRLEAVVALALPAAQGAAANGAGDDTGTPPARTLRLVYHRAG